MPAKINRSVTLADVEADMKILYDKFSKGEMKREDADSFANVAGKRLKAVQLDLANDIFSQDGISNRGRKLLSA